MFSKSYQDLNVWKISMELAEQTYRLTRTFPKHETYGLCSQMHRAAPSIPSNIAEGHERDSTKEFLRLLSFAPGSLAELETQFLLATRLGYLKPEDTQKSQSTMDETGRMLHGLQRSLKAKLQPQASGL